MTLLIEKLVSYLFSAVDRRSAFERCEKVDRGNIRLSLCRVLKIINFL